MFKTFHSWTLDCFSATIFTGCYMIMNQIQSVMGLFLNRNGSCLFPSLCLQQLLRCHSLHFLLSSMFCLCVWWVNMQNTRKKIKIKSITSTIYLLRPVLLIETEYMIVKCLEGWILGSEIQVWAHAKVIVLCIPMPLSGQEICWVELTKCSGG